MTRATIIALAAVCLVPGVLKAEVDWICVTDAPEWTKRTCHASVVFDDKLWLFGGCTPRWPDTSRSDVWCSEDGANWTCKRESAPWGPRCEFSATVHNDTMWILGGNRFRPTKFYNDVWCSTDGDSWVRVTDSADWAPRACHAVATHDGRMWVMSGYRGTSLLGDVWWSEDGKNWTMACSSASWSARDYAALAVHRDTMWLMGGLAWDRLMNDVWWSVDGINWTEATGKAAWDARWGHTATSYRDTLWVMGGAPDPGPQYRFSDIWYSVDGASWNWVAESTPWRPRGWHTALVLRDSFWLVGGDTLSTSLAIGEVWKAELTARPGIEEQGREPASQPVGGPSIARGVLVFPARQDATLLDVSGRKVSNLVPGHSDVRHLSPGIYFLHEPDGPARVRKVIVTR